MTAWLTSLRQLGRRAFLFTVCGTVVYLVLPNTVVSNGIDAAWGYVGRALTGRYQQDYSVVLTYVISYTVLCVTLTVYVQRRLTASWPYSIARIVDACAALSVLYLTDLFTSAGIPLLGSWILFCFTVFFFVVLFASEKSATRIVQFLMFAIAVQCTIACYYHLVDYNQLLTRGFGTRTMGTFSTPNSLYLLAVAGVLLSIGRHRSVNLLFRSRWLARAICTICCIALVFTFTRGAWLGLAAGLFTLLRYELTRTGQQTRLSPSHGLLFLLAIVMILFVRTHGSLIGGKADRSSRGRIAIWRTAASIVVHHPLLGTGLSTYALDQQAFANPELTAFDPRNSEAKSLYLNILVESGIIGLLLLGYIFYVLRTHLVRVAISDPSGERGDLAVRVYSMLISIGVAGCVDTPILTGERFVDTFVVLLLIGCMCVMTENHVCLSRIPPPLRASEVCASS